MTLIASFSTGDEPSKPPAEKKLQYAGRFFTQETSVPGQAPRGYVTERYFEVMPHAESQSNYKEVAVSGMDACSGGPYLRPLFESEWLGDGYTSEEPVQMLKAEMQREIRRLRASSGVNVSTPKALASLQSELLDLHELGYTMEELQRLVRGSLRISITTEELQMALFANTSGP